MQPMAILLMNEAHDGAVLVEKERKKVSEYTTKNLRQAAGSGLSGPNAGFTLPWVQTQAPSVGILEVGSIADVRSSVYGPDAIDELKQNDIHEKYLDKDSNLYAGNINAKLPEPDNDLAFKLSSLPAAVEQTVAPARITAPQVFVPAKTLIEEGDWQGATCDQLPSALKLTVLLKLNGGADKKEDKAERDNKYVKNYVNGEEVKPKKKEGKPGLYDMVKVTVTAASGGGAPRK
jgi:hypothetical protein